MQFVERNSTRQLGFHVVIKLVHSSKFGLDRVVDFGRQEAFLRVRASQIGE
jgi:hypothetical protein